MENQVYYQPPTEGAPPAPYVPNYALPPKKTYAPLEKRDSRFIFVLMAGVFLFVDFALFHGFHLGFTIAYAVLCVLATVYLWDQNSRPDFFSLACGAVSLAGAATFALFNNYFINAIMAVLIAGLFTLYCLGVSHSYAHSTSNYKVLFDLLTGAVTEPLENFGDIIGSLKAGGKKKKNLSALFGILIAVPVLAVIIPLLISSDAAFENLIGTIAKNIGKYLLEVLVALLITPFLFSYFYGKRKKRNVAAHGRIGNPKRMIAVSGSVSFLSVISLTYVVYLVSQLAYFFSAFSGLLPEGYTRGASAFARRGFYETFAVCAINVVMISLICMLTKRRKGKVSLAVRVLSLFISLFSVLMIITAIQKMKLNITTYGFTRNRLLVFVFMLMMLVVIFFFIVHIFAPKVAYMQPIILICSVMFVALSFMNIDAFTFERNLQAYESGHLKTFDWYTVENLTNSELYYVQLAQKQDGKLSHRAVVELLQNHFVFEEYADGNLQTKYQIKNGELVVNESKDFRRYCRDNVRAGQAVKAYFQTLTKEEREAFVYNQKQLESGYYDTDSDTIRMLGSDITYGYNAATGRYDTEVAVSDEA